MGFALSGLNYLVSGGWIQFENLCNFLKPVGLYCFVAFLSQQKAFFELS